MRERTCRGGRAATTAAALFYGSWAAVGARRLICMWATCGSQVRVKSVSIRPGRSVLRRNRAGVFRRFSATFPTGALAESMGECSGWRVQQPLDLDFEWGHSAGETDCLYARPRVAVKASAAVARSPPSPTPRDRINVCTDCVTVAGTPRYRLRDEHRFSTCAGTVIRHRRHFIIATPRPLPHPLPPYRVCRFTFISMIYIIYLITTACSNIRSDTGIASLPVSAAATATPLYL